MGLDANGFSRPTLDELKTGIESDIRFGLGASVNLLAPSVLATITGIIANGYDLLWSGAEEAYNQAYPDSANGISLDNGLALSGLKRQSATPSRSIAQYFFGTVGKVVPALTQVSVAGNPQAIFKTDTDSLPLVAGNNEIQTITFSTVPASGSFQIQFRGQTTPTLAWNITATALQAALNALSNLVSGVTVTGNFSAGFVVTFGGPNGLQPQPSMVIVANTLLNSGSFAVNPTVTETTGGVAQATVNCTAIVSGPTQALAGTLSVMNNAVSGITGTINSNDAILGNLVESDPTAKIRRRQSLQIGGSATVEAIRSKLLNLTGVTAAIVFENQTYTVDANGRPPKSYECVVQGGSAQDIANTIWTSKAAGMQAYGQTSANITDSMGFIKPMYYSVPTIVPVYITVSVTRNSLFPADGLAQVQAAFENYVNSLGIGMPVIVYPGLVASVSNIPGITNLTLAIGTAPSPVGTSNVAIALNQLATTQSSWIAVT